jgi:hypothetical protein
MTLFDHRAQENPAEEAARLLTRIGVFLLFAVSLVAPILAGQTIYILLPIGAALLLAGAALSPFAGEKTKPLQRLLFSAPALSAMFLVAWAALSLTWTPFSGGPAVRLFKNAGTLALVAVAAGFLPKRTRGCNLNLLPIGVAVASFAMTAAAAFNLVTQKPQTLEEIIDGTALARVGVGLALIMWPAAGALAVRGRWVYAAALIIVAIAASVASGAPNVAPALVAGLAILGVSFGRTRRTAAALGSLSAALIVLAPIVALIAHFALGARAQGLLHPLEVWGHIVASGGLRALIGHGYGSAFFGLFGGYLDPHTPRSLVFEIWFDLGALGAGAFAAMASAAFLRIGQLRPALAPFLLAGLAAGLVISLLGPAAEQLWAFTQAGLAAIAYVLVIRGQFRKKRPQIPASWAADQPENV